MRIPDSAFQRMATRPVGPESVSADIGPNVGGAVSRSASRLGGALTDFGGTLVKLQESADELAASDATTYFEGKAREAVTGIREKVGLDAMGASGAYEEALKSERLAVEKGLRNGRQKASFLRKSDASFMAAMNAMESHVAQETRRAEAASMEAAIDEAVSGADAYFRDDSWATTKTDELRTTLNNYYGTKEADRRLKDVYSAITARQIAKLLDGTGENRALDAKAAIERFRTEAEKMTPHDRDAIGKVVNAKLAEYSGQALARMVADASLFPGSERVNPIEARTKLLKLDEGPIKDEATKALSSLLSLDKSRYDQLVEQAYNKGLVSIESGRGIPSDVIATLSKLENDGGKELHALRQILRQRRHESQGLPPSPEELQSGRELLAFIRAKPYYIGTLPESDRRVIARKIESAPAESRAQLRNAFTKAMELGMRGVDLTGEETKSAIAMASVSGFPNADPGSRDWRPEDKAALSIIIDDMKNAKLSSLLAGEKFDLMAWKEGFRDEYLFKAERGFFGVDTTKIEAKVRGEVEEAETRRVKDIPGSSAEEISRNLEALGLPSDSKSVLDVWNFMNGLGPKEKRDATRMKLEEAAQASRISRSIPEEPPILRVTQEEIEKAKSQVPTFQVPTPTAGPPPIAPWQ